MARQQLSGHAATAVHPGSPWFSIELASWQRQCEPLQQLMSHEESGSCSEASNTPRDGLRRARANTPGTTAWKDRTTAWPIQDHTAPLAKVVVIAPVPVDRMHPLKAECPQLHRIPFRDVICSRGPEIP